MNTKRLLLGLIGFAGFFCLLYFKNEELIYLAFVGFFAFFGHFFIGRISGNREDERYVENSNVAMAFSFKVILFELFLFWCLTMIFQNAILGIVLVATAYASAYNIYAVKFYILEEK